MEVCWGGGGGWLTSSGGREEREPLPAAVPCREPRSKVVRPGPNGPGMPLKEEGIREVFWGKCPRAVAFSFEGSIPGSSCCWAEGDVSICFTSNSLRLIHQQRLLWLQHPQQV